MIGLAGKHTPKFQIGNLFFKTLQLLFDRRNGILIGLIYRHFQQLGSIVQATEKPIQSQNDQFQARPLATERLCPLLIAPDRRVFQFPEDFGQFLLLFIEVKDTP